MRTAAIAFCLGLSACAPVVDKDALYDNAQFWQRQNVTETAYMEGPKVQQALHRDIARCVVEIRWRVVRKRTPCSKDAMN